MTPDPPITDFTPIRDFEPVDGYDREFDEVDGFGTPYTWVPARLKPPLPDVS